MVFLACRALARRSFASAVSSSGTVRRPLTTIARVTGGLSLVGGCGLSSYWWLYIRGTSSKDLTPPKYVFGSRKLLNEINGKPSPRRLLHLLWILFPLVLLYPLLWLKWLDQKTYWAFAATQLEKCGPCFVKLAQWVATRRDIFSPELCEELGRFHEAVDATWSRGVKPSEVRAALEQAGVHFESLDEKAISSGTIGEVFFGTLKDGTEVAVKCLRPDIRNLMESDLAWLLWLGRWADRQDALKRCGLGRATEDFCEQVWMQMDFEIEADHLKRFTTLFGDGSAPAVFPTALYTGPDVLVLSRERGRNLAHVFRDASEQSGVSWAGVLEEAGTRISEKDLADESMRSQIKRAADLQKALGIAPELGQRIAFETLSIFMQMIFRDAFIHGDLHPGNIILRLGGDEAAAHNQRGSWPHQLWAWMRSKPPFEYAIIDAGLAIPLPTAKVQALRSMAIAILYADYDRAARVIYNESPDASECVNPDLFVQQLGNIFKCTRQDVVERGYLQISDACLGALKLVNEHKVGIDTELTWVLLSMLSIEGAARQFDPLLDATAAASKHIVTFPVLVEEFMDGASRESCKQMVLQMTLEAMGFDYWQYRNGGRFVRLQPLGTATPGSGMP